MIYFKHRTSYARNIKTSSLQGLWLKSTACSTVSFRNIVSPCRWIWLPSRCRSSRWPMQKQDKQPDPSSEHQCGQSLRKSLALCVWVHRNNKDKDFLLLDFNCYLKTQHFQASKTLWCDWLMTIRITLGIWWISWLEQHLEKTATTKKVLTPKIQWQKRWRSHGDWWSYSPSEIPYRNLEWRIDKKDIQCHEEIQAFTQVSKLHSDERSNVPTETEEWSGAGTFTSLTWNKRMNGWNDEEVH